MWANEDAYFAWLWITKTWKSSKHAYDGGLVQRNPERLKGLFLNVRRVRILRQLIKAQISGPCHQCI